MIMIKKLIYCALCAMLCLSCSNDDSEPVKTYDYVDLGLTSGTLWATCNVGANTPEEYGHFFAWGETSPKTYYDMGTYKWCSDPTNLIMSKYCANEDMSTYDNKRILEPADDAATVNWGSEWRMPTIDEALELIRECTWTWTTQKEVNGCLVTGPNGKSIFMPAAGCWFNDIHDVEQYQGSYWTSSLSVETDFGRLPTFAELFFFEDGELRESSFTRHTGNSVRPVRAK